MSLEENPYSAMLNTIRHDTAERSFWPWQLGEVVTVEPLVIKSGDHPLKGKDLWVNYQVIENEEPARFEDIEGWLEGSTNCGTCSEGAEGGFRFDVEDGKLEVRGIFGGVLHPGDKVVLLASGDDQEFVVLCRVVEA